MLTKNQLKLILSLSKKKYRTQEQLFVAEGVKVVREFLDSDYVLVEIFSTDLKYAEFTDAFIHISDNELSKISTLTTPNTVLATFRIPESNPIDFNNLILALDDLNNPGNLGTIIRLCDWFGIKDLVCSLSTVDCYNPKVVQAAMGSHTRVNITYIDLESVLSEAQNTIGTFMQGHSIYEENLPNSGILVLGNEANGISKKVASLLKTKLTIPRFGPLKKTESLNVANAASIILSEFRRQSIEK
ncbi:MAG: TrmH family RNA methyltransferase [Flavobacteriaceae bacterium]